ncbi:MAG: hypothetical protein QMB92_02160, partial [Thiopseudomonas sp.]
MHKSAFTLACCMVAASQSVQAAPVAELDSTVVTATKNEHNLSTAPATVTVITAEQIKASGASNVLEAVR